MKKEEEQPEYKRRKEDSDEYKFYSRLKKVGTVIVACTTIGGAITWAGSTVFSTKTETAAIVERITNNADITKDRVNYCEKDILVIKEKLQGISDGQKEHTAMLREIRDDLRRNRH